MDVLSSQGWEKGIPPHEIWQSFMPVDGPSWLRTPLAQELVSTKQYYPGRFAHQAGLVDAAGCPQAGSRPLAQRCLRMVRGVVDDWQNQFDAEIMRVAEDTGVPAQLMKNFQP